LLDLFSVFVEFEFLGREAKGALLHALGAKFFVVGYQIKSLALRQHDVPNRYIDSHPKRAVSVTTIPNPPPLRIPVNW
jgi:hypothetical protein